MNYIMKLVLTILLIVQLSFAKGQKEFIGTVNSTTGMYTINDSISGVNFIYNEVSSFDKNTHRIIFYGIDFSGNKHLYCVDAISGTILSQPTFTLNAGEFHYDNTSNKLYGIYINNSLGKMFIASIDINTASTSIIDTLPFTELSGGITFFDEVNHIYTIQNSNSFYSINVNTGVINIISASATFDELQFDNTSGMAYGLVMGPQMILAKIDVSNGSYTTVTTFSFSGFNSAQTTFSENNHTYVFSSNNNLYSVDVNTGNIISSPTFPVGISPPQNIIELHYDNSSDILYALHWGTINTTGIKNFSNVNSVVLNQNQPNPFAEQTIITYSIPQTANSAQILFYDMNGKQINSVTITAKGAGQLNVYANDLSNGTYSYTLIVDGGVIDTKKMIKQ